ncbi:MAG: PAS domain S-box protein [Mongoliitalea sp.]
MTVFKKTDPTESYFLSSEAELSFLRGVMRRSLDMIAILDKDGVYKYISPAVIDILGYQPSQIIGKSFREFVSKGSIEIDEEVFDLLLASKEQMTVDFWMRKADGRKILLENLVINLLDDPNIQGILFNGRDITDLFSAKKSLEKKYKVETLLADLSAKFVNSVYENLDGAFHEALEKLTTFFGAEKGFIYRSRFRDEQLELVYQWEISLGQLQQNLCINTVKDFFKTHDSDGLVFIEAGQSTDTLEIIFPYIFGSANARNCLFLPFYAGNDFAGFFGVSSFNNQELWTAKDLSALKQLGDIFSGAFVNRAIKKRLDRNENLLLNTEKIAKSGSWRYSFNQNKIIVTPGFCELFEISTPDLALSLKEALKLIQAQDRSILIQKIRKTLQTGSREAGELLIQTDQGNKKFIFFSIQTKSDMEYKGPELYGYMTDVTDMKKSREEIIRSQERYRLLASNIPNTNVFLIDRNFRYVVSEGTLFENWKVKAKDFEGKLLSQVHTRNLNQIKPLVETVIYHGEIVESVLVFKKRHHQIIIRPIIYGEKVEYAFGIVRDIEDEYTAREQLMKSEEKFRTLVEDSTEIIFSLKPDLTITYLSPNIEQYLGFEAAKVIGSKLTEYMHPNDLEAFEEFLRLDEHFLSKNQFLEFKLRTKDDSYKTFASNGKLIYSSDGVFLYNGIARDVTKLREAQKELILAKERAEMAANAKTQFLSIMSHEIRTPMNAVIGLTHLLIEENPRPDQLENLKTLQFSAENLLGLINDILDFNKMESGKLEIESIPIDIKNLINRLISSYKFQAREKDIQIIFDFDQQIPNNLLGDPVRFTQIINNLLSNAIKFTESGFIKVVVKRKRQHINGVLLDFTIQDTGIGIPEDKIQDIFNAFTQASTETTRKFGGTGLGLAIVKKLIQLFGSEIHVHSQVNKGTTINFAIKFATSQAESNTSQTPIQELKDNLREARVLIAEDNVVNQLMIRKFMQKWGVRNFTIVNDGQEAIEVLADEKFDLLILDLQMPRKDGLDVARFIRSHEDQHIKDLPLIAMTASPWEEIQEKFEELKMNEYVPKPFNPDHMYAKLIKLLQHNLSNF